MPSAIGERTAFMVQQNKTAEGSSSTAGHPRPHRGHRHGSRPTFTPSPPHCCPGTDYIGVGAAAKGGFNGAGQFIEENGERRFVVPPVAEYEALGLQIDDLV